jgi:O-antigen/teichoic acid export membrane protein
MATNAPPAPCDSDGDGASRRAADDDNSETPARSPSLTKSVLHLASGRAAAVAIGVLSTPIVTRLYDETNFGIVGLVGATASLLYPFTSGFCYVLAMPLATSASERRALFVLTAVLGFMATAIVAVAVLIGGQWIAVACGKEELGKYLFFVPLSCLCATIATVTTMALNCRKEFGRVAVRTTVEGVVRRGVQIGAGLLGLGGSAVGLLLGSISAVLVGALTYSVSTVKTLWHADAEPFRISQLGTVAVKYKNFPRFRLWSESLTRVSGNFAMIFLGLFFPSLQVVGCYAVARSLLAVPFQLFTYTSQEVFYVEAAGNVARGESVAAATSQLLRMLSLLTAFPLTAVFVLGPLLFEVALGARWHEAGVYAQIMAPWIAIRAIGHPLAVMFDATNKMAEGLACNIVLLATQVVLMVLGGYFFGARAALACYTVGTVLVWAGILVRTIGLTQVGRIRAARLLIAPYIEALLLLAPAGMLYWVFEMRISALVAFAAVSVAYVLILNHRYPAILAKLIKRNSR